MSRLAAVDVGTNSVLLLVAERAADGVVRPVREEAEITRLGRGVDRTGVLSAEGMDATLEVLARFAALAREDGARALVVTATSAARDARNGAEFLVRARERTGATVEILSGDEEARLSYLAVAQDFAADAGEAGLLAIDVGGGSTELVHGRGGRMLFRRSLDIGSVRLTERCVRSDPPTRAEQDAIADRAGAIDERGAACDTLGGDGAKNVLRLSFEVRPEKEDQRKTVETPHRAREVGQFGIEEQRLEQHTLGVHEHVCATLKFVESPTLSASGAPRGNPIDEDERGIAGEMKFQALFVN